MLRKKLMAALLALCVAAPAFAVTEAAADCCCLRAHRECHCPVCVHAREADSGRSQVRECAQPGASASLPSLPAALPVSPAAPIELPRLALPFREPPRLAQPPPAEVLTPPPLA
ncbi:MAG TPA: hypothetical protein VLW85_05905 [Myxococcales bacterium]|nr:hypothetical protein [Myxococcales bacterium]